MSDSGIAKLVPHQLFAVLDYRFHESYYAFQIDAI
jgi:hypothetical protein